MAEPCAIVGIGQTKHDKSRADVSMAGLVREAAIRALDDAGLTWRDMDAVVLGKAPDAFEGVMQPELFLAEYIGWQVAVKDRLNALKNPYAHLQLADISIEKVKDSPMLWDPIHFLESCPSSDGACAMVLTDQAGGLAAAAQPAWVLATAVRSELSTFPGRDAVRPQAGVDCAHDVYRQAGITDPHHQIDVAELYVPFSWYEPMWLEGHDIASAGEGWKMTDRGDTEITGSFPVNPSGGVLSSNPIGASGMLRLAEAALQVRGQAGEHQVDGARVALGQAYGGNAQYFSMAVFSSDLERPQ